MLLELRIRNLAVIDELRLEFGPGLNVLTGETGAGKSIILGSLGLVLGEKATADLVRTGEELARVDATFDVPVPEIPRERLEEAGVKLTEGEPILVARTIHANGRSRAYVNGQSVTTELVKTLGDAWVDLHGQHEHQSLFRVETHLELLDAFGQVGDLRRAVADSYDRIQSLRQRLRTLQTEQKAVLREKELLEYEVEELNRAGLRIGEEDALGAERKRLLNAERLFATAESLFGRLYDAPASAVDQLRSARSEMQALRQFDDSLKDIESRLEAAYYEIEDLAQQIRDYRNRLEFSPTRLEEIEARLHLIAQLKRRYGATIDEILIHLETSKRTLETLATRSAEVETLRELLRAELREAARHAFALSERRQQAARLLEATVEQELAELAMAKTRFVVAVTPMESDAGLIKRHEKSYNLSATGLDRVEFLIAPNVGEALRALNRVASGGEISRTMLALKTALRQSDTVSTLVFDEVDVGIGGVTGTVVGRKLRELAASRQVICITHLPQIAAFANVHFQIAKRIEDAEENARTFTTAQRLDEDSRIAELARMLGGDTATSRAHARQLLGAIPHDADPRA